MTELEWAVIRIRAQIQLLDWAAQDLLHDEAPRVLELGLGNGRTYDHLRQRLPKARIDVFDREMKGKLSSRPPDDHFFEGELDETLASYVPKGETALIHADLGTGDPEHETKIAAMLVDKLPPLARDRCLVISSTELVDDAFAPEPFSDYDRQSRYNAYRIVRTT